MGKRWIVVIFLSMLPFTSLLANVQTYPCNERPEDAVAADQSVLAVGDHASAPVQAQQFGQSGKDDSVKPRTFGMLKVQLGQSGSATATPAATSKTQAQMKTLTERGSALFRAGKPDETLVVFEDALTLARQLRDKNNEATILLSVGVVHARLGHVHQTLDYYKQALLLFRAVGNLDKEATTLNAIAAVYNAIGERQQALDNYNQALVLWRAVGDRAGEAATPSNLGTVYAALGDLQKALDYYDQALTLRRTVGDRAGEAATLNNLGPVYARLGEQQKAFDYYKQALVLLRDVGDRAGEAIVLNNFAVSEGVDGDALSAMNDYRVSVTMSKTLLGFAALDSSISNLKSDYTYSSPYQRLAVLLAQQGKIDEVFSFADRARGLLLRTELTQQPIDFRASANPELLAHERQLTADLRAAQLRIDALRKLSLKEPDNAEVNTELSDAQKALDMAYRAYRDHQATMQRQGGFLDRQLAFQTSPLSSIQQALPADTTLVLYAIGAKNFNSIAFLVTGTSMDFVMLNVDEPALATQVSVFTSNRQAADAALSKLFDTFFAPLVKKIHTQRLIIMPDGKLNYVPFAALKASDGSYLIDHYIISLLPSATSLVLLKDRKTTGSATSEGLVLAQRTAPGLPDLRFVRTEADGVARVLGVKPNLDATTTDLRQGAAASKVLYISAHAVPNSTAPLFGVIYLGEANGDGGRFEVRHVYGLDLNKGTELVVLSGCNTGIGGELGGGEDFGVLVRAFFGAGAPRVVASLWSVDDQATATLMTRYMQERAKGTPGADALRTAMLDTRQQLPDS